MDGLRYTSTMELEFNFLCNVGRYFSKHIRKNGHLKNQQNYSCAQSTSRASWFLRFTWIYLNRSKLYISKCILIEWVSEKFVSLGERNKRVKMVTIDFYIIFGRLVKVISNNILSWRWQKKWPKIFLLFFSWKALNFDYFSW